MIYFGIPLKSSSVSKDWAKVTSLFNRTLRSIYDQTCPDFKIFVACHEVPELDQDYDDRVQFLISETPHPTTKFEMMLDKGWKLSMISMKVREAGGGYTMMVDADDLISNRIAAYVKENPGKNGFLSRYGYVYNDGGKYVKKVLDPYRICGSCSIVNYRVEDLPDHMPEDLWDDTFKDKWTIRMSHRRIPDHLKQIGRELETLPFPSTIYIRNTGENHSMLEGNGLSKKRRLELLLRMPIRINNALRTEYGLR